MYRRGYSSAAQVVVSAMPVFSRPLHARLSSATLSSKDRAPACHVPVCDCRQIDCVLKHLYSRFAAAATRQTMQILELMRHQV